MTVAFNQVILPRHHEKVFSGQSITVLAQVINASDVSALVDAFEAPVISLFDPLDARVVSDAEMVRVSKGLYSYTHRVPFNTPLGVFTGNLTAVYDNEVARLDRISLFKVIKLSIPLMVTYQVMKDQNNVTWYWWIDVNKNIMSSLTPPSFLTKAAMALIGTYHWIEVDISTPILRYVYPSLVGTPIIGIGQPVVGSGASLQPVFTNAAQTTLRMVLNAIDEITLEVEPLDSTPSVITYQTMKDQNDVTWYWWVDATGAFVSSSSIPVEPSAPLAGSYHWVIVDISTAISRYIYPSLAGTPTVDATQPVIGTGISSQPVFTSFAQEMLSIMLNEIDEIILETV